MVVDALSLITLFPRCLNMTHTVEGRAHIYGTVEPPLGVSGPVLMTELRQHQFPDLKNGD